MRKIVFLKILFVAMSIPNVAHSFSTQGPRFRAPEGEESVFVLEPYFGYERGYLTQKGVPTITTEGAYYGARVGGRILGVALGLDYFVGSESASQSEQKSDFNPTEYGVFMSYRFFSQFNLYVTYFLSAQAKVQSSENPSDFLGSGYKIGLGWSLFSFLDVNLEYYARTYGKYGGNDLLNPLLSSTMGLSLSVPIF